MRERERERERESVREREREGDRERGERRKRKGQPTWSSAAVVKVGEAPLRLSSGGTAEVLCGCPPERGEKEPQRCSAAVL